MSAITPAQASVPSSPGPGNGDAKADARLHEDISVFDMLATYGGCAVVAGLITEVILAFVYRGDKPFLESWGPVFANTLVAFGVIAEIYFHGLSNAAQSELDRRSEEKVSAANKRAAEALLEAEKLRTATAWRTLSGKEHRALALALRASGTGASVRISVLMNDQESLYFAERISIPFRAAGWQVGYEFTAYLHGIMTGILLPEAHDNWLEEITTVNKRVRDAFIAAEIDFANGWTQEPFVHTQDHAPLGAPIARIYVGPKPMPPM